jgi:cytochrome bd-type quinol oxidase subunit 1
VRNGDTILTLIGFVGLYFVLGVPFLYLVGREIGPGPDDEPAVKPSPMFAGAETIREEHFV